MANFTFTLDDFVDPDGMDKAVLRELQKDSPQPLSTSAAQGGTVPQPDIIGYSDILQNIPVFDSTSNVLQKQNALATNYLQNIWTAPLNHDQSQPADISANLPLDILDAHGKLNATAGDAASSSTSWVAATGTQQQDAQAAGTFILQNGNIQFANTTNGQAAKQEIQSGLVSPNICYILWYLATQGYSFQISAARDGKFPASDLHYAGMAVDITAIIDPHSGKTVQVSGSSSTILGFLSTINSITGPYRPTAVGSPFNVGWAGFLHDPASLQKYQSIIHIENSVWGNEVPVVPGSTSAADPSGSNPTTSSGATQPPQSSSNPSALDFVQKALSLKGLPYVEDGAYNYLTNATPPHVDCSSLVQWSAYQVGAHVPRTSGQQWQACSSKAISVAGAASVAGALLFVDDASGPGGQHVAISSGDGKNVVQALNPTDTVNTYPLTFDQRNPFNRAAIIPGMDYGFGLGVIPPGIS